MRKGNFGKLTKELQSSISAYLDQTAAEIGGQPGSRIVIARSFNAGGETTGFSTPNIQIEVDSQGVNLTAHSRHVLPEAAEKIALGVAELARAPYHAGKTPELLGISQSDLAQMISLSADLRWKVAYLGDVTGHSWDFLMIVLSEIDLGRQMLLEYCNLVYGERPLPNHNASKWDINDRNLYRLMGDLMMFSFDVHRIDNIQIPKMPSSVTASLLDGTSDHFRQASFLLQEFGILADIFHPKRFVLSGRDGQDPEVIDYLFAHEDNLGSSQAVSFVLGKGSSLSLPTSRLDANVPNWREMIVLK
jgi:hypothetical protein